MKMLERLLLGLILVIGLPMMGCDDDTDDGSGTAGTAGSAGIGGTAAVGGGGMGGEAMGGMGGEAMGGMGGEAMGGMGGEPGGEEPMGGPMCDPAADTVAKCMSACAWLGACAASDAHCPGIGGPGSADTVAEECQATCEGNAALATLVCTHTMCVQTIQLAAGASEAFASDCEGMGEGGMGGGGEAGMGGGGEAGMGGDGGGEAGMGGEMMQGFEAQAAMEMTCSGRGCHIGAGMQAGGVNLDDLMGLVMVASSAGMPYITAGDHTQSYIWHKVNNTQADAGGGGSQMPLGAAPWSQENIDAFAAWIDGL